MNVKTWGLTETGSVFHSFKADSTAICRSNVKAGYMFRNHGGRTEAEVDHAHENNPHLFRKCTSCAKKEAAHRARVEASMAPVNPYDQVCEGVVTPEGAALAAGTEAACCEHAGMYHGARGCDECGCSVPRSAGRAGNGVAEVAPAAGDECETVIDAEAMSQADDALAFAMTAGAPGTACPECERRTGHKLDCSTGRREPKTGQDIDPVVLARQAALYSEALPIRKLTEWLNAE